MFSVFAPQSMQTGYGVAMAQNNTVKGVVKDATGEPIVGASVVVKGMTQGTVTDVNGNFSLDCKPGQTLVISYIGFANQEVVASSNVNVTLQEDRALLDEVVVLGYGVQAKKKDLSAAVGVIADPESLAKHPVSSPTSMLQGQLPGVTVESSGGNPSSGHSLTIRGAGSKNGESPLWVVDGVPNAPIPSVNEIESMVVLKDAASAAIYGAQSGSAGVILVTTKKPTSGVHVAYDLNIGVNSAVKMWETLDAQQELEIQKLAYDNAGQALPDGWDVSKNPWISTTRTNWMKEIFRNALFQRHNLAFSGGSENFRNRLTVAYQNNEGAIVSTFSKDINVKYRGDLQINKWVKITEDLNWNTNTSRGDNFNGSESPVLQALCMPQSAALYNYNNTTWGGVSTDDPEYIAKYGNFAGIHGIIHNPMFGLADYTQHNNNSNVYTSTALEVGNILPGLKFISRFTYTNNHAWNKKFSPKYTQPGEGKNKNTLYYDSSVLQTWKTENTITYDNTFGKHTVGALLSTTADFYNARAFSVNRSDFVEESDAYQYFQFGTGDFLGDDSYVGDDTNVAVIGRAAYSYDDRYFVTASVRRDWAGRLPTGHNYGTFPAFTAGWKVSNEKFWEPVKDVVNFFKIRASWGRIGNINSIGMNYKSSAVLKKGLYCDPSRTAWYGVESGAGWNSSYRNTTALNPNLTWEKSEQLDLGFDLAFLGERLSLSFDYYNKRTYDLIQEQTMNWPSTIGVSPMLINNGEIQNRGFEVSLGWNDKVGKDFSYYINANASLNKNKVTNIGVTDSEGNPSVWEGLWAQRDVRFYHRTQQGGELYEFFLIKSLGVIKNEADLAEARKAQPNAQLGDLWFEDFNHDGNINNEDRQYMGNATADFTYAVNLGLTWKKLTVSAMLQGVQGAQHLNLSKMAALSMSSKVHNRSTDIYDSWTFNKNSDIPRISVLDPNNNFMTGSSWYLENASYLRVKNISVSYDLSSVLQKVAHFNERKSGLTVFFSGENLFTFTKYTGLDPECGAEDFFKYPTSKTISFGLKLTY